jgi:hypothetical protein
MWEIRLMQIREENKKKEDISPNAQGTEDRDSKLTAKSLLIVSRH